MSSAKAQAVREGRLNALLVLLVLASLLVVGAGTAAVVVAPRPLQLWLPGLLALLSVLGGLASLVALNNGRSAQQKSSVLLYLLGGWLALALNAAALGVLLWGLGVRPLDLRVALPLLGTLLALALVSVANLLVATAYQSSMPEAPPVRSSGAKYASAYSNPVMHPVAGQPKAVVHYSSSSERVSALPNGAAKPLASVAHQGPNGTLGSLGGLGGQRASYASYSYSTQPKVESLKPAGSHHSILTMTSDL